ncbi:hypothetical protein ACA910_014096 [Epithemia clementina (nom. ined.)]
MWSTCSKCPSRGFVMYHDIYATGVTISILPSSTIQHKILLSVPDNSLRNMHPALVLHQVQVNNHPTLVLSPLSSSAHQLEPVPFQHQQWHAYNTCQKTLPNVCNSPDC